MLVFFIIDYLLLYPPFSLFLIFWWSLLPCSAKQGYTDYRFFRSDIICHQKSFVNGGIVFANLTKKFRSFSYVLLLCTDQLVRLPSAERKKESGRRRWDQQLPVQFWFQRWGCCACKRSEKGKSSCRDLLALWQKYHG